MSEPTMKEIAEWLRSGASMAYDLNESHVEGEKEAQAWLDRADRVEAMGEKDAYIKELVEALKKITHEIDDYDEARQWVSAATLEHCLDLIAKYKDPSE